ncbi:RNA polymerase II-associated protein 1 isoform X1 [Rhynchophorus ferrugineus]
MLKRPTPYDDEDEILRQQEEFFKQKAQNKIKPAAVVVSSNIGENACSNKDEKNNSEEEQNQINIQEQIANTFEAIPTDMKLKEVVELNRTSLFKSRMKFDSGGFPKAVRRDPSIQPTKGSIFSQHIKRIKRDVIEDVTTKMDVEEMPLVVKENLKDDCIVTKAENRTQKETTAQISSVLTTADKRTIHEENINKLKAMSSEEILAEKEQLVSSMDPALIQFLRSRKARKGEGNKNRNPTIHEQNEAAETIAMEELDAPKEILSKPESEGWLNFNKFEASKLAWMKDIKVRDLKKTTGFEARFDFDGYLLPYCVSKIDESNRHLYHHGDEPERPGYTLQELMLLSRSNVIQQKIIALNTLGNILSLDQTGIYDRVIDIPIEQVFFVIRFCLDDNTPSVLNGAIKALRNLIYFQIDETCIDNMLNFGVGFVQPILAVDNIMEDDNTVNDQQLAETNLIKCLARTDILIRIRYIINNIKPSLETILYCLDILTRLARDSDFIMNRILQCDGLFSSLMKYFVPSSSTIKSDKSNPDYFVPLPQMIKFLRVVSSRSRGIAENILRKYEVLDIVVFYLYDEMFSQNARGMRLQVEVMHYWRLLIHYGLGDDAVRTHQTLLLKLLDYHFKNTDNSVSTTLIRQSHLSALLLLISKAVEKEHHLFPTLIPECFIKWINQFGSMDSFKCGHSQITSSVLLCAAAYNCNYSAVLDVGSLERMISSEIFCTATKDISNGSLLLNNYETHKTTANLKSLEAAVWHTMDHIVPVLQLNSCMPFLYALTTSIMTYNSPQLKLQFLNHPNIQTYTSKLKNAEHYYNVGNWFNRCETFLVMNLLKIAKSVGDSVNPTFYYDIAVKGLSVFSAEQKRDMIFLLDNVVFCPRFYPVEVALQNTRISDKNDELTNAWSNLDEIKTVYANVLGLTKNNITFETTLSLDMSIGNVIPMDWIYTPLVLLYANQQKRTKEETVDEQADFRIVLNCLRWILIYETYFHTLAQSISVTEKYVRLSCLFLGSDNLFLLDDIQTLLVRIYGFINKAEAQLNFEQEISGLTNFKDFYVQLLEQYQAVSYGNKVFANVLLFPLMKRHDVKYRKTLWSEYMGVVETFTVTKEDVWINWKNLIYPIDTEQSLCRCYLKALQSGAVPKRTILYDVAEVNVKKFQENATKQREKKIILNKTDKNVTEMEI